jgi:hypothetical protein
MGRSHYTITEADNSVKIVDPQRSVNLAAGISINFGNINAEIRV